MRTWCAQRGPGKWESVLSTMSAEDREELEALVPVGWYDLGLQHRLLRAVDSHLGVGNGALVDEIGIYEADQDLTIVHRLFLRFANPAYILEKAGQYWGRFYDTGEWTVVRDSKKAAHGKLANVEPFDEFFARYLHAYIRRMWELVGARKLRIQSRVESGTLIIEGSWD